MKKFIGITLFLLIIFSCKKEQTYNAAITNNNMVAKINVTGGQSLFVSYFRKAWNLDSLIHPINNPYHFETEFKTNIGDTIAIFSKSESFGVYTTTTVKLFINNSLVKQQNSDGTADSAVDLRYIVR